MKICPVGAELFHADGQRDSQTGMMKLIVAFCNFVNVPKSTHFVDTMISTILRNLSSGQNQPLKSADD